MSQKYYDKLSKGNGISNKQFTSGIGLSLLQKMGWTEGRGLGKDEVGIVECIQIKKKHDNLGIGAKDIKSDMSYWSEWWKETYNSVARELSHLSPHESISGSESNSDTGEIYRTTKSPRYTKISHYQILQSQMKKEENTKRKEKKKDRLKEDTDFKKVYKKKKSSKKESKDS
ncbi:G-patch domain-containing protein [Cryptosporidium muris RN66]|uniref:G-patch domain-containing protein n=1 Tax=Cryptosporidium muris (strain RN66) TaxID=441375 RepID=B6AIU3_CRYMR|nr:G-patch domain-containing protein [Cryptosporidium muris RN66]EEA08134.1 G-patch domain-containing protein [Cryptosporidium muris RN66]|eukprot:XP_002142483.1 G-patch domain-containing protein [Cryptosporidium muris RN66]